MKLRPELRAVVDEEGRLVLPPEAVSRFGLKPGIEVLFNERGNDFCLRRPITHLSKVYIEPTNRCNLECRTCMRNVWSEPLGEMSNATFAQIVEGLRSFSPLPTVMTCSIYGTHPNTCPFVSVFRSSIFRHVLGVAVVTFMRKTKRIVSAILFPPAGVAFGRKGLFNALEG